MSWKSTLLETADDVESRFDELRRDLWKRRGWLDPVRILPYRGYADEDRVLLRGRVLEAETRPVEADDTVWDDLVRWFKRVESDEIPGARLTARWRDHEQELTCDEEGFFTFQVDDEGPSHRHELVWEEVDLEMIEPIHREADEKGGRGEGKAEPARTTGHVLLPAEDADFAVVSDLDDTVIRTGADDFLRMARTIFLNNARTRSAFPGVAAFYHALQRGTGGPGDDGAAPDRSRNPVFYVSSSPWNYYDLFDQFMEHQGLPHGPIFLKEFGLDDDKLIKSGHSEHKLERIRSLMDEYPRMPFVLIGDSGQHDAEIYSQLAEEQGDRLRAVYIRDVTKDPRDAEVRKMAEKARGNGVEMVLVDDTVAAARHAAEHGLIPASAVEEVEADREQEEEESRSLWDRLGVGGS